MPKVGPDMLEQVVTPVTPVIVHEPTPVGAAAPEGPVTVAVKVIDVPKAAVEELATTETEGVTLLTNVVYPEVNDVLK